MIFPITVHRQIIDALEFLDQIYAQMPVHSIEQQSIFDKFTKTLRLPLIVLYTIYGTSLIMVIGGLILWNIFDVEYHYMAPMYLPGVPSDTADGFELNSMWHFSLIFYVGCVYGLFDGLNIVLVMHVLLLTNLVRHEFRQINVVADEACHLSDAELLRRFKNAVEQQIQLRRYSF